MSKLLKISEASSIAVHSLALIASNAELLNATRIAEITGFSRNHIAKVLNMLVKKNYLDSTRGPKGGFLLRVPPNEITLFEVFELVDGTIDDGHCFLHNDDCPFDNCVFGNVTTKLTNELIVYYKNNTINDFIKN